MKSLTKTIRREELEIKGNDALGEWGNYIITEVARGLLL